MPDEPGPTDHDRVDIDNPFGVAGVPGAYPPPPPAGVPPPEALPPSPPPSPPTGHRFLPPPPSAPKLAARPPTYDPERLRRASRDQLADADRAPVPAPAARPTWRIAALAAAAAAVVAAAVTGGLFLVLDDPDPGAAGTATGQTAVTAPPPRGGSNLRIAGEALDIQALLEKAQPAVVSIETGDPNGIFGGAGSGVIIGAEGLVLTNAHVVSLTDDIRVRFFDGQEVAAEIVGTLPGDDIAVIQAQDTSGWTPAELGSSASLQVGDDVVAIGNALGLGGSPTVTEGIVSAKDRTVEAPGVTLTGLIQTDAAINPGNSGGPLLNAVGQVVGINTAIIEGSQNVGFAISIDNIKPLIDDILAGEGVTADTAFLGVGTVPVSELDATIVTRFEIGVDAGAFVQEITPDSPADRAGLRAGDVITSIDGEPAANPEDVARIVREHQPGDSVIVSYERLGADGSATAVLCKQTGC